MKVLITGASGMVGRGVLLECLDHDQVKEVYCLVRSKMDVEHPKLTQLIHQNFSDYSTLQTEMVGFDAAYLCMGISAAGMKEKEYSAITYDYTLTLAKALLNLNANMTLTYVSGEGTDSTEKGRTMWARVKGKTENDLLKLGFKQAYMFRPGAIIPLRGIKSRTKLYQFVYDYFMWLVKLMKAISPRSVVDTTQIGLSMINAHLFGYPQKVLRPADIQTLASKS